MIYRFIFFFSVWAADSKLVSYIMRSPLVAIPQIFFSPEFYHIDCGMLCAFLEYCVNASPLPLCAFLLIRPISPLYAYFFPESFSWTRQYLGSVYRLFLDSNTHKIYNILLQNQLLRVALAMAVAVAFNAWTLSVAIASVFILCQLINILRPTFFTTWQDTLNTWREKSHMWLINRVGENETRRAQIQLLFTEPITLFSILTGCSAINIYDPKNEFQMPESEEMYDKETNSTLIKNWFTTCHTLQMSPYVSQNFALKRYRAYCAVNHSDVNSKDSPMKEKTFETASLGSLRHHIDRRFT